MVEFLLRWWNERRSQFLLFYFYTNAHKYTKQIEDYHPNKLKKIKKKESTFNFE